MGNFRHYIKGISSGDSYFTLEKKLSFVITCLSIFHIFLAVICCLITVYPLMIYSTMSVAVFLILCRRFLKNGRYATTVLIAVFEVFIFSLYATICLGYDCGFSIYNIAIISSFFYLTFVIDSFKKQELSAFILTLFAILGYIVNYVISIFVPPLYPIHGSIWEYIFFLANHIISFSMIIIFNFLFIWEIKVNQNTLASQNRKLDIMANQDPLTHLLNRRCMNVHLAESMRNLKLSGKVFSLVLCDIDDFKKINDTYGHDAGDLVLVNIANLISDNVRADDKVCRWGGEEILILIQDPLDTAAGAAERIRKKIENSTLNFDGKDLAVTMTFGVSEAFAGAKLEQFIQKADDRLYQGKHNGKNQVVAKDLS